MQAAAKNEYMGTIRDALSHDPDGAFELVNLDGVHDEVYEYLDEQCRRTGRMPDKDDIRDAAERIQAAFIEQEESRYKKAQASKKLARRLGWKAHLNSPADAPEAPTEHPNRGAQERKTLNAALAPTPAPDDDQSLPADRIWEQTVRKRQQRRQGYGPGAARGRHGPRLQLGIPYPPTKSRSKKDYTNDEVRNLVLQEGPLVGLMPKMNRFGRQVAAHPDGLRQPGRCGCHLANRHRQQKLTPS